jgi:hypothetical protein
MEPPAARILSITRLACSLLGDWIATPLAVLRMMAPAARISFRDETVKDIVNFAAAGGIDAVGRFIKNEEFRMVDERLRKTEPLQHSLGVFLDADASPIGKTNEFEEARNSFAAFARRQPGKGAVEIQHAGAGEVGRKTMIFRQISDRTAGFVQADVFTKDPGRTRRSMHRREKHFYESGFARSVRAKQAEFDSNRNAQSQVANGFYFLASEASSIYLFQALGFDGVICGAHSPFRIRDREPRTPC